MAEKATALRAFNRRCAWCAARLRGWDLLRRYCRRCRPYTVETGQFLTSPPPVSFASSAAFNHHRPGRDDAPRPLRASWLIRLTCQHCWHLDLDRDRGSFCCECGQDAHGLPVSPCVVCSVPG